MIISIIPVLIIRVCNLNVIYQNRNLACLYLIISRFLLYSIFWKISFLSYFEIQFWNEILTV